MVLDKPWYMSKTIWAAVLMIGLTIVQFLYPNALPYEQLIVILGGLGLWGIRDAQGNIIVSQGKKRK